MPTSRRPNGWQAESDHPISPWGFQPGQQRFSNGTSPKIVDVMKGLHPAGVSFGGAGVERTQGESWIALKRLPDARDGCARDESSAPQRSPTGADAAVSGGAYPPSLPASLQSLRFKPLHESLCVDLGPPIPRTPCPVGPQPESQRQRPYPNNPGTIFAPVTS